MKCMNCGNEIPENARFCNKCGSPVQGMNTVNEPETARESKKLVWKDSYTIIAIAAVMVIAAGIGFMIKSHKEASEQDIAMADNGQGMYEEDAAYGTGEGIDEGTEALDGIEDGNGENGENPGIAAEQSETDAADQVYGEADEGNQQVEASGQLEEETGQKDYILPGSDSRLIDKSELEELSPEELRLARNELYARHGRKFDDEELQNYFNSFDWYVPSIDPKDFDEDMLNDYEFANRDLIVEYETEMGYR